jgi:hypothetical protein
MDLPDRRIRAANQALADLDAVPVPEILGRVNSEVVEFDDVEAMKRALDAVSSGAIDGRYKLAVRRHPRWSGWARQPERLRLASRSCGCSGRQARRF